MEKDLKYFFITGLLLLLLLTIFIIFKPAPLTDRTRRADTISLKLSCGETMHHQHPESVKLYHCPEGELKLIAIDKAQGKKFYHLYNMEQVIYFHYPQELEEIIKRLPLKEMALK